MTVGQLLGRGSDVSLPLTSLFPPSSDDIELLEAESNLMDLICEYRNYTYISPGQYSFGEVEAPPPPPPCTYEEEEEDDEEY